MTYQDYFILGSPLIICCYGQQEIGTFRDDAISGGSICDQLAIPRVIKRQVTEAEYYATLRPEYRESVRANAEPGYLFYEVSVD